MAPRKRKVMQKDKITAVTGRGLKKDFNKNKREKEIRNWSDLPTDLLEYIMSSGLYLSDITNFHAVCKGWRSIKYLPNHKPLRKTRIPWLMIYCRLSSSWKLIDPSSSSSSSSNKTHILKIQGIGPITVCGTKFGWLLLSRTYCCSAATTTSFSFYSPFTNERIDLPDLDSAYDVATFSSLPTSTDSIVFVLYYRNFKFHISICRQGDKAWSTKSFPAGEFFPIESVIYSNSKRAFYCSNRRGRLATFDLDRKSWSILSEPKAILNVPSGGYSCHMVGDDNGGELLLLVLISDSGRWVLVHKLDRSKMEWVKVENLIDKSVFISRTISVLVSKNEETKGFMNRIYYCLPSKPPKFYSFKARKSYHSAIIHYGDLSKEEIRPKNYFWIEAP